VTNPEIESPAPSTAPSAASDRQIKIILAAAVIAAAVAMLWPKPDGTTTVPGGFLVDAMGRPTPLAGRLQPVTLLHFWATWCPPCIEEIPALERLARDFREEADFRIALVAVGDQQAQVERFLTGGAEDVLYDPQWEVAKRFGTDKLPESFLLVQGKVTHKFVGATDWDDPAVRQRLRRALDARSRQGS
jgi:thiol-disulfide isomerase/thioredoxin